MAGLGLENYGMPDSSITASSDRYNYRASQGRLYQHGSWVAFSYNKQQWFQVDFGNWTKVTGVAIQGNLNWVQWVKKFKLAYSYDGVFFREYKDDGDNAAKVPFYCRLPNGSVLDSESSIRTFALARVVVLCSLTRHISLTVR